MIVSIIIISMLAISTLIMTYKYIKLKSGIKQYDSIGTGKVGFYVYTHSNYSYYNAYVYVKELDRYTDGYSKIEISNIEPLNKNYISESKLRVNNSFLTLMKTNEIEWLESEDSIRKIRKEKLDNLKKL